MKSYRVALILAGVISACLFATANAAEKIKSRSPNVKFAMRLTEDGSELIEVKSGKVLLELKESGAGWAKDSKLLWSPDSKYFAHFSANRRGGSTTVYRQNGATFEEVELPEFPDCEKNNAGKVDVSEEPKRWLNSNTLVLVVREGWTDADSDEGRECERTVTIAFDSNGRASVKDVKESKK
jgi:hypothetical protein